MSNMRERLENPRWSVVILTANSEAQAELFREEVNRRVRDGRLAPETRYLVVADPEGKRIGSGGATIHALGKLAADLLEPATWWKTHRVLMIHSGGDSRRLPQYAIRGKLFGVMPAGFGHAETTSVFDEMLALFAECADQIPPGLLVASGDVILRFEAGLVDWSRPGVTGVAMRLQVGIGRQHGVYVCDERGRVYTFLQKPSVEEIDGAGGLIAANNCAVDSGLLFFDAETVARLTDLAGFRTLPAVDLYEHFTKALTGQWKPESGQGAFWRLLSESLRDVQFHCSIVSGEFVHVGTTRSFRAAARTAGGLLDSAVAGECEIGAEAVVLECDLEGPLRASRGAVLHGLTGIPGAIEIPEDTVVHQVPIRLENRAGSRGGDWVVRVYGVGDDPKEPIERATWFGRPLGRVIEDLGLNSEAVWSDSKEPPSLWNAALFPAGSLEDAWECAKWMMGLEGRYGPERWQAAYRMSLADSSTRVDGTMLANLRDRRIGKQWTRTVVDLAETGVDLRPMLAYSPGLPVLAEAGKILRQLAQQKAAGTGALHGAESDSGELSQGGQDYPALTHAGSLFVHASRVLARAGLHKDSCEAREAAFRCIERAVEAGITPREISVPWEWRAEKVTASAPARIDLGGGWSDTPPFCLDWGGTVLNIGHEVGGGYPIETTVRRLREPVVKCVAEGTGEIAEFRIREVLSEPTPPGSVFAIPRAAVRIRGVPEAGGIEIRCHVRLPVGSGLGTSSILAATVVRALAEARGERLSDADLSNEVMRLEQMMTTGGGWQDQAGAIFPGAKLLLTGPGLSQRIRVRPVEWTQEKQDDFCRHLVLFDTGIRRMAKNLLQQVVTSYLARETDTVQVLHSIKTLALEMSYAMAEGDWRHLGELIDRHWRLNQVLDPNTSNGPINALFESARPFLYGAKLAGAGGGGYAIFLAKDAEAAAALRARLGDGACEFRIAEEGLRVSKDLGHSRLPDR